MPADSPRNAIARQWELLKQLPSGAPGKSAANLNMYLAGAGYGVTKRTVERDLEALEALFPITHGDEPPFDWHWVKGGAFGVMGLSTTDALSLHLLERFLRPILPAAMTRQLEPMFAQASNKLAAQKDSNTLGRWAAKVAVVAPSLPVIPAPVDAVAMQAIQESLLAEETVSVNYLRSGAQAPRAQTLHPLGLVQCGPIMYLVATAFDYPNPRLYAMHRVQAAKRLHEPARVPPGFSLQGFIDDGGLQFGDSRRILFKAWVSSMLAGQLRDSRLTQNQSLEPSSDGFVLSATLPHSWRLRWWILSKTGDIEVISPKALRQEIGEFLQAGAARYQVQDGALQANK